MKGPFRDTTDKATKGISNSNNTRAFGHDKLIIFHLKNLGPKAIEYLTALFTSCQIPAIWKSSIVISISKPDKDSSLGTSYRLISLLCPAAKVMDFLMITTVNLKFTSENNKRNDWKSRSSESIKKHKTFLINNYI